MFIPVSFFVAIALALLSYSVGQGGPIAGLVFFAILGIGILAKLSQPLVEMAKPHLPERLQR